MVVILGEFEKMDEEPLCVQFANTVGNRGSANPTDSLRTPDDLKSWADKRQLPSSGIGGEYLKTAKTLREAIYRILYSVAEGAAVPEPELMVVNQRLQTGLARLGLDVKLEIVMVDVDLLDLVAISTFELLTSELRARVRVCANGECAWLFLDRSKNRSRRWCSMSDCGNLAKAKRFRNKGRLGEPPEG